MKILIIFDLLFITFLLVSKADHSSGEELEGSNSYPDQSGPCSWRHEVCDATTDCCWGYKCSCPHFKSFCWCIKDHTI
nr:venom protein [Lampona murina]